MLRSRQPLGSIAIAACAVVSAFALGSPARAESIDFRITPAEVRLEGNFARAQLVVTQTDADGKFDSHSNDLTSQVKFASSDAAVVSVNAAGELLAVGNGQAIVTATLGDKHREVSVTVGGIVEHPPVPFSSSIRPILNKAGCAMAACHAAQHGKGGFKLSVFGFDPKQDREAMAHDWFARRINSVVPEQSLLLLKPSMQVPHGGGRRLAPGGVDYQILRAWIASGAPGPQQDDAEPLKLHVFPAQRQTSPGALQQLRVEAEYADGSRRDVTAFAKYASMDDGVVSVAPTGMVTVVGKGQSPVMIIFDGQVNISLFVVPYAEQVKLAGWQNNNFIDELAAAKFRELGIEPSPLCDDATFLRRAYFDAIGTLPTPEETLAFLESAEPDKRTKLIDRLLGLTGDPAQDIYNDAYAAYWSLKWSDLLRNNSAALGEQGMWAMHNWIKEAFRTNRPFDEFVRELITARGSLYSVGPANYFRVNKDASSLAEATAQTFLGVRMECAKCHHHPFEKYSQDDYYGLAAFFARVGTKRSEEFGLFGGEQVVVVSDAGEVRHPQTGKNVAPKPLDATAEDNPLDRRIPLAAWLTSPENEFFADSVVNRYMSYLLGKGLVEPVDDLRSTNPPSNPPLMKALAEHFVENGYDLKQLLRTIMNSRLYQLDSQPTPENAADERFFSHYGVKRLTAEPLSDAIDRVTLVQTKFKNLPLGTRAIELPDAEYPDYFLNTFAKPRRVSVCECERVADANLAQALHTLNGDLLTNKIADKNGRIAKLLVAKKPHQEIVTELYLCALNRLPTDAERAASDAFLAESISPAECYQDLLWALLNSKQFLFVR
jgi:hypothetical protein